MKLKNAWYILSYNDINWESGPLPAGPYSALSPDIFFDHINYLNKVVDFVNLDDGINLLKKGNLKRPIFSVFFNNGLAGVRRYGFEILNDFNIKAAVSINSDFIKKEKMWWRYKLGFISAYDSLKSLRTKLRRHGFKNIQSITEFVERNFSPQLLNCIDEVYNDFFPDYFKKDAFRIFESIEGIKFLKDNGWEIVNEGGFSYFVKSSTTFDNINNNFIKCELVLKKCFNVSSIFKTFDNESSINHAIKLFDNVKNISDIDQYLILNNNKINDDYGNNILHKISVNNFSREKLFNFLKLI